MIGRLFGTMPAPFREGKEGIAGLNRWIGREFRPFMERPGGFGRGVEAAFLQAVSDGVTRLEMSIDVLFGEMFGLTPGRVMEVLEQVHRTSAPQVHFLPELGFSRTQPVGKLMKAAEPYFSSGFFRSVDLYDDESAQPAGRFRPLYRLAAQAGLKRKAHAGEFGDAESVRMTAEVLELDAVQHGIGAASSPDVMRWLAARGIPLNICPTSNIRLKRVRSYKVHPIRILFDSGVCVTLNTDDVLVFGDGVSEQFLKLWRHGVFSLSELETIRMNSFR